jgi:hypothetical protein
MIVEKKKQNFELYSWVDLKAWTKKSDKNDSMD